MGLKLEEMAQVDDGDKPRLDEDIAQLPERLLLHLEGVRQLLAGDQVGLYEHLAQVFVFAPFLQIGRYDLAPIEEDLDLVILLGDGQYPALLLLVKELQYVHD